MRRPDNLKNDDPAMNAYLGFLETRLGDIERELKRLDKADREAKNRADGAEGDLAQVQKLAAEVESNATKAEESARAAEWHRCKCRENEVHTPDNGGENVVDKINAEPAPAPDTDQDGTEVGNDAAHLTKRQKAKKTAEEPA